MADSVKVMNWIAARGWTFTEMSEAQKTEMRTTLNICGYATSGSKRQKPCVMAPMPNGRCKTPGHGGMAAKGIAHPGYKHGIYSRYSPTKWIHSLERAAKDPELFNLRRDVELAESGLNEALERMDLGAADDRRMAQIIGSVRTLLSALERDDEKTSDRMLNEIPELIEATKIDADVKREVIKWMGVRLDLIAEDSRMQHRLHMTVPLEEASRQFMLLANQIELKVGRLVARQVLSKDDATKFLQSISDDFVQVAGFERLPGVRDDDD